MSGTIQKPAQKALTERYEALLRVSQTLISIRSSEELFNILARELRAVVNFYVMGVGIYDEKAHEVHLKSYGEPGIPLQVPKLAPEETFTWWVYQHQQPLIIPSLDAETRFAAVAEMLKNRGVRSVYALPLTTVHRRLGGPAVGSTEVDAYSREEVSFLSLIANQVALAVDDALNFEASQHAKEALRASETGMPYDHVHRCRCADGVYRWFHSRGLPARDADGRIIRWYFLRTDIDKRKQAEDRLQLLLDVTNQVVSNLQLHDLLRAISTSIRRVMQCDLVSVCLPDSEMSRLQTFVLDFPESRGLIREEYFTSIEGSLSGLVFRTGKAWMGTASDILQLGLKDEAAIPEGLKTGSILPLVSRNRILGVLSLGRREESAISQDDIGFLAQVASRVQKDTFWRPFCTPFSTIAQ